jgi:uncharacterized protein (DUF2062 family)
LHTLLAIGLAFLLNLNRVAVLLGVYSNLPWIIGAYYTFTTMIGSLITRTKVPPGLRDRLVDLFDRSLLHAEFWHGLYRLMQPLFLPYLVGSLIGGAVMAAIAYPLALAFVRSRRRLQHMIHKHPR